MVRWAKFERTVAVFKAQRALQSQQIWAGHARWRIDIAAHSVQDLRAYERGRRCLKAVPTCSHLGPEKVRILLSDNEGGRTFGERWDAISRMP